MSKTSFTKLLLSPRFYLVLTLIVFISVANIGYALRSPAPEQADTLSHQIVINEVAWAGTQANSKHLWIELFNPGTSLINLSGWSLWNGAEIEFALDGEIAAGEYFLIEIDDLAISPFADIIISNLSMNYIGDILTLKKDTEIIDVANAAGGVWPGGGGSSVCSMERDLTSSGNYSDEYWHTSTETSSSALDSNGNAICGTPAELNSAAPIPTPTITPAADRSIVINEVAWMGNLYLVYDEWIELYNPGSSSINLAGWTLSSTSNDKFYVALQGTIPAKGYFVLGRFDDTISNHPGGMDQVSEWNLLSNSGDSIYLHDPTHKLIDTANKDANSWPAGSAITFCSMERGGSSLSDSPSSWLTFADKKSTYLDSNAQPICGSPWGKNWGYDVTPTPSPVPTRTPTPTPTGYRPVSIVLNEFLVRPREDHNHDGVIDSSDAYIEIINLSHERKYLDGWRIDDQAYDSPPFFIDNQYIDGDGGKLVFYAKDTNILLSAGTDSVRLFNDDYALNDAFTYTIDPEAGKSWCRFSDGYGTWTSGCNPSPGQENNYKEVTESDPDKINCDFYSILDKDIADQCKRTYEWNFDFDGPLFEEPIEINIGGYRLLIK